LSNNKKEVVKDLFRIDFAYNEINFTYL